MTEYFVIDIKVYNWCFSIFWPWYDIDLDQWPFLDVC